MKFDIIVTNSLLEIGGHVFEAWSKLVILEESLNQLTLKDNKLINKNKKDNLVKEQKNELKNILEKNMEDFLSEKMTLQPLKELLLALANFAENKKENRDHLVELICCTDDSVRKQMAEQLPVYLLPLLLQIKKLAVKFVLSEKTEYQDKYFIFLLNLCSVLKKIHEQCEENRPEFDSFLSHYISECHHGLGRVYVMDDTNEGSLEKAKSHLIAYEKSIAHLINPLIDLGMLGSVISGESKECKKEKKTPWNWGDILSINQLFFLKFQVAFRENKVNLAKRIAIDAEIFFSNFKKTSNDIGLSGFFGIEIIDAYLTLSDKFFEKENYSEAWYWNNLARDFNDYIIKEMNSKNKKSNSKKEYAFKVTSSSGNDNHNLKLISDRTKTTENIVNNLIKIEAGFYTHYLNILEKLGDIFTITRSKNLPKSNYCAIFDFKEKFHLDAFIKILINNKIEHEAMGDNCIVVAGIQLYNADFFKKVTKQFKKHCRNIEKYNVQKQKIEVSIEPLLITKKDDEEEQKESLIIEMEKRIIENDQVALKNDTINNDIISISPDSSDDEENDEEIQKNTIEWKNEKFKTQKIYPLYGNGGQLFYLTFSNALLEELEKKDKIFLLAVLIVADRGKFGGSGNCIKQVKPKETNKKRKNKITEEDKYMLKHQKYDPRLFGKIADSGIDPDTKAEIKLIELDTYIKNSHM
jgi:hypothetical protein